MRFNGMLCNGVFSWRRVLGEFSFLEFEATFSPHNAFFRCGVAWVPPKVYKP